MKGATALELHRLFDEAINVGGDALGKLRAAGMTETEYYRKVTMAQALYDSLRLLVKDEAYKEMVRAEKRVKTTGFL